QHLGAVDGDEHHAVLTALEREVLVVAIIHGRLPRHILPRRKTDDAVAAGRREAGAPPGSVPARDDRPAIRAAPDLADDPRIDLTLLVIGRRGDPELVEQTALDRVVVLQQRVIRDVLAIGLDRLEHRAAHVAEAARQRLADPLTDHGQRVERTMGDLRVFDALVQHLTGEARANGADAAFGAAGDVLHGGLLL